MNNDEKEEKKKIKVLFFALSLYRLYVYYVSSVYCVSICYYYCCGSFCLSVLIFGVVKTTRFCAVHFVIVFANFLKHVYFVNFVKKSKFCEFRRRKLLRVEYFASLKLNSIQFLNEFRSMDCMF